MWAMNSSSPGRVKPKTINGEKANTDWLGIKEELIIIALKISLFSP